MNDILRERLIRKLDTLPEEKIYQILDYIDFLESKYAPKVSAAPNPLKRFAEGVEDTLRAGKMSAGAIAGTMSVMNKAVGVVTGVANAGKSVATEIVGAVSSVTSSKPEPTAPTGPTGPTTPTGSPSAQTPPTTPPGDQRKWEPIRLVRAHLRAKALVARHVQLAALTHHAQTSAQSSPTRTCRPRALARSKRSSRR